jgi:hypothetical protein
MGKEIKNIKYKEVQENKREEVKNAAKENSKLEKIDSEQKRSLTKVEDIYEKQQSRNYEVGGCLLFAQKMDQYVISKLKREENENSTSFGMVQI